MAGESIGQNEIDQLLKQAQGPSAAAGAAPTASAPAAASPPPAATAAAVKSGAASQAEIDQLLNQAEQALASINSPAQKEVPADVKPFRLPDFSSAISAADSATLDLIRDVELDLRIELGRTHMHLEEVLKLAKGSVVALDKLAGDPVDIFVNGRLIARGEVLILNENFCVRVAELMAPEAA
jgi:flagellar motor switch protein FliN